MNKNYGKLRNILLIPTLYVSELVNAQTFPFNDNWKFSKSNEDNVNRLETIKGGQRVSLPHTWNAFDGQGGGLGRHDAPLYYRGIGWYTNEVTFDKLLIPRTGR